MHRPFPALLLAALLHAPALAAPDFAAFQAQWQAALARDDGAEALVALTRMPFLYEGRPHDAKAFVQRVWPRLFTAALRRCLMQAKALAEAQGERAMFCRPYSFHFDARDGRWQLREFGVDAEDAG